MSLWDRIVTLVTGRTPDELGEAAQQHEAESYRERMQRAGVTLIDCRVERCGRWCWYAGDEGRRDVTAIGWRLVGQPYLNVHAGLDASKDQLRHFVRLAAPPRPALTCLKQTCLKRTRLKPGGGTKRPACR